MILVDKSLDIKLHVQRNVLNSSLNRGNNVTHEIMNERIVEIKVE